MIWDSSCFSVVECSLAEAHANILNKISPLGQQQCSVSAALHRITTLSVLADQPKPLYDQSTRDGFALSQIPQSVHDTNAVFRVTGEVAAGCQNPGSLGQGEAVRIMTGGMLPRGAVRVVPFEVCTEQESLVAFSVNELSRKQIFIQKIGSEIKKGRLLVPSGMRLLPEHLLMLTENGCSEVAVSRQPRVAVICTGSELVTAGETPRPGQKISGNGVLLPALIEAENGQCPWTVTVGDEVELITGRIRDILCQNPDMIITTGGMGPGKFDLMEQVFASLGGELFYNRLRVRPGKFTLFGLLNQVPLFALPGPPPAVRLLFHELVSPALQVLQGRVNVMRPLVRAKLVSSLSLKRTGHLSLKGGVAALGDKGLQVYPAGRMEPITAIMHLREDLLAAGHGEQVQVRLLGQLQGLTV